MKPITDQVFPSLIPDLGRGGGIEYEEDSETLECELHSVVETLDRLVSDGTLEKGSLLANAFERFVSASEGRLAKIKAQSQEPINPYEEQMDWANPIGTLVVIENAIYDDDGLKRTLDDGLDRILVHVKEVQRSVATAWSSKQGGEVPVEEKDGDDEEKEHKEKAALMAFDSFVVPEDL